MAVALRPRSRSPGPTRGSRHGIEAVGSSYRPFTRNSFKDACPRAAARPRAGSCHSPAGKNGCLPAMSRPPLGKTPQCQLLALLAARKSPNVQIAAPGEKPDRLVLDNRGSHDRRLELDRPGSLPIAAKRHDAARSIHDETGRASADRRAGQRSIECPGPHRAQVAGGQRPDSPVGRRHDDRITGRCGVGNDPLVEYGFASPTSERPAWS